MTHRLTILHMVTTSSDSAYFTNLARYHDRRRFRLLFGTLDGGGPIHGVLKEFDVASFSLDGWSTMRIPSAILRLAALLRREGVDICQTHLVDASRVGLAAARLAGVQLRILTRHHSNSVHLSGRRLPVLADQVCNRLADRIFAASEDMIDVLVRREHVPPAKIARVHYGSDFERIRPSDPSAAERVRQEFGLNGCFTVGMVGRLYHVKGHAYLFEAIRRLREEGRSVRALIVGRGPEQRALQQLAERLGLCDAITITGYREDLWDVMAAMDVLVVASLSEGFNQVIIESMGMGKPILSTRVGVARDIICDGENGLLVPMKDAAGLAQALARLMDDRALAARLAEAGHQVALGRFGAQEMVRAYENWYERWWEERGRA